MKNLSNSYFKLLFAIFLTISPLNIYGQDPILEIHEQDSISDTHVQDSILNTHEQEPADSISITAKVAEVFFRNKTGLSEFYRIDIDSVSENISVFNFLIRPTTYEIKGTGFVIIGELNNETEVLAYSDEDELNLTSPTIKYLLSSYQEQIDTLKSRGISFPQKEVKEMRCQPLLGETAWGQGVPYNNYLPIDTDGNRYLLGCMATAMGQIMHYHKYPDNGEKHSLFINNLANDAPSIMVDYSDFSVNWNQVEPTYAPKDSLKARVDICELLYYCALSVGAEFSSNGTSSTIVNAHHSLLQHFKFHPKASLIDRETTPSNILLGCLYKELEQKRPIMISSFGHAFICDGCYDDYFHLNWGWYGQCNGYYKFTLLPENDPLCMPEHAIIDLFPRHQLSDIELDITVDSVGTLRDRLPGGDDMWNVSKLKITGPLNGKDFMLLRQMAGARKSWEPGGCLQELDLSEATLTYDSISPYYYRDLKREHAVYTYTHTVNGISTRQRVSFEHLSMDEWDSFRALRDSIDNPKESLFFTENGNYMEGVLLQNDDIGEVLFKNCISLRRIILPKMAKSIGYEAFRGCFLLEEVTLPIAVEEINASAFSQCTLLDRLKLDESNQSLIIEEGALYTKDMKQLICFLPYYRRTHFSIPDSVEEIRDYAFADNLFLCDVALPPHIKYIPNGLFYKCMSLKHVIIPQGVEIVKNWVFSYCRSLMDVYIPSSVKEVGEEVFTKCLSLERIYCNKNQVNIHETSQNELESLSVEIHEMTE